MSATTAPTVTLNVTESAATEIRKFMAGEEGLPETSGLRVRVVPGGCSGFQYSLNIEEQSREGDFIIDEKGVRMFETVAIPVLGIVENMSYFIAPDTGNRYNIFGEGGGQALAARYNVPFLGAVPLGIEVREGGDKGVPFVVSHPDSPQAQAFRKVTEEVARQVSIEAMKPELVVLGKGH